MSKINVSFFLSLCLIIFCCKDNPTKSNNVDTQVPTVDVAGGTFTAGTTMVTISSFKIDKYEVTYVIWTEIRNWGLNNGYSDLPTGKEGHYPGGSNNPVTEVTWYDIVKWCNARSEKDGFTPVYYTDHTQATVYKTGKIDINTDAVKWSATGYRLPTECEWEFAARGGNQTHGYTYSGSDTIGNVAWYSGNSGSTTHTVGQKSANELGIYDMSGNVWEWCWDWYDNANGAYPFGGTSDPRGPSSTQSYRMLRGGSYYDLGSGCRVGLHSTNSGYSKDYPGSYGFGTGFRCVRD